MNDERLITIFNETSKYFYGDSNNLNHKSRHWKRYDSRDFTLGNLINFRKGELSDGLDNKNQNFSFKLYAEVVNEISEPYLLHNMPTQNIGNADTLISYKNVFIDPAKLFHIYWFWTLERKIELSSEYNICEIGGGFGSFSELFIKNYNNKMVLIDLPEANLMSSYYLRKQFPKKRFFLFDDYKKTAYLSKDEFDKSDIIILPPNCDIDKNIQFDLIINTRSMMEMNFDVITSYFDFIHLHSKVGGYFLNINRYEKKSVGSAIRISEYPYDRNWKVIISMPSFNQNKIHFLLTQRSYNENENDIVDELKNIDILGRKFYRSFFKDNLLSRGLRRLTRMICG